MNEFHVNSSPQGKQLNTGLSGRVLITGGTGSLGMAILERAEKENWPCRFTVIARNEAKINQTKERFPHVECRVGSVEDFNFLRTVFAGHDLIVGAAAQKVVPLAESNVRNAIQTNVFGTMNVCQAAIDANVLRVITILTDKLVSSSTVYGATKFLAGAITREANILGEGKTRFCAARYGNVIGSANSILPHLLRQKAEGKPFTITDARCTRFWLTLNQAIDLILLAYAKDDPATTVVPKAPASHVLDLFRAVDPLYPVVDIGIRPGEKIHELLIDEVEARNTVDCGDHFVVFPPDSQVVSNLPDGYRYSSENPEHKLSIEELRRMLYAA